MIPDAVSKRREYKVQSTKIFGMELRFGRDKGSEIWGFEQGEGAFQAFCE